METGVGIADTDGCHLIKDDLPSIGLFDLRLITKIFASGQGRSNSQRL